MESSTEHLVGLALMVSLIGVPKIDTFSITRIGASSGQDPEPNIASYIMLYRHNERPTMSGPQSGREPIAIHGKIGGYEIPEQYETTGQ